MPSPYQLPDRWLEWKTCFMPELESLKRQIDCIKREIDRRNLASSAVERMTQTDPVLAAAYDSAPFTRQYQADTQAMQEVLATLERLMPPF